MLKNCAFSTVSGPKNKFLFISLSMCIMYIMSNLTIILYSLYSIDISHTRIYNYIKIYEYKPELGTRYTKTSCIVYRVYRYIHDHKCLIRDTYMKNFGRLLSPLRSWLSPHHLELLMFASSS